MKCQKPRGVLLPSSSCYPLPLGQQNPKCFSVQQKVAAYLIIPKDPFSSVSVLSPPDTYTSCSSPPSTPPVYVASSSHLLLLIARVPNEAPWECSLAPSLKIDLFSFCCFPRSCWNKLFASHTIWPSRPGIHATTAHTNKPKLAVRTGKPAVAHFHL